MSDRSVPFVFALAAALGLFGGVATSQRPAEPKPLWQINERKLGVPRPSGDLMLFKIELSHGRFGFQNNNTLLISWITPDGPLPRIPKKASPIPAVLVPSHLHVLFLDAKTGTRLRERELSVPSGPTELFISHSGNLLVRAGNSLKLYTPDFDLLNQADLPAPVTFGSFNSRTIVNISADGRRIGVCSEQRSSAKTAIFDADDLTSLGSLPDGQQRCTVRLGDDSFLFNTSNGMEVRTIDGKLLMTDDLPKGQGLVPLTVVYARESTIFAVETTRVTLQLTTVGETPIPMPMHLPSPYQIAVYSLKEKRRIFSLKVKGGTWGAGTYELSPDGSLFATLSNGWVRVYKLP